MCPANFLKANSYFAFLLVGLVFIADLINVLVFIYDRRTLEGIEL